MAQTGYTPIILYHSTTAAAAPTSGNLNNGELALNIQDEKLYFKNAGGTVKLLASSAGAAGDVVGPASATDNAIVRFDGTTGKLVQNSVVTIADSTGDISGVGQLNATTLDATNIEVTNIKAKDGTASATIADSTGVMTIGSSVLTTADINGGTIDGTAIGGSTPAAGAFTTLSANNQITSTMGNNATLFNSASATTGYQQFNLQNTGAQTRFGIENSAGGGQLPGSSAYSGYLGNVTNTNFHIFTNNTIRGTFSSTGLSVTGTLSSTGNFTVNTNVVSLSASAGANALVLNSSGNVGIGTASPGARLHVEGGNLRLRATIDGSNGILQVFDTAGVANMSMYATSTTCWFGTVSSNDLGITTNNVERLRITAAGDVGIGTASPGAKFVVQSTGNTEARISTSNNTLGQTNTLRFSSTALSGAYSGGGAYIQSIQGSGVDVYSLAFGTADVSATATERMRISSSGNVGIGTSSPAASLSVVKQTTALSGTGNAYGLYMYPTSSGLTYIDSITSSTGNTSLGFRTYNNGTYNEMRMDASGNVGIGTTSPSFRLDISGSAATIRAVGTSASNPSLILSSAGITAWSQTVSGSDSSLSWSKDSTERMRINSSGNVGIGTTSPDALLTVNTIASFGDGAVTTPSIAHKGDLNTGFWFPAADTIAASTGGSERIRIDSSGNLLVGTTDSASTTGVGLKQIYNATVPYIITVVNDSIGSNYYLLYNTNATNNGYRFYVQANGGVANYSGNNTNLSDERTKENIELASSYLNKICAIPVKTFNYKDEPVGEQKTLGVIAQDVEAVAPEFVNNDGFGETKEGEIPFKSVYTTDLMFALMKSIQELKAELDTAKARIAALEAK